MYKKTFNVFALCSCFCKYEELFLAKYSVNYSDKIISWKISNEVLKLGDDVFLGGELFVFACQMMPCDC